MERDEMELIEQTQANAESMADEVEETAGVDRREFVLMAIAAAAVGTVGIGARASAQGSGGARGAAGGAQQAPPPLPELTNADPVSWTFQPYPGGTGALMEKTIRERGAKAFERATFKVDGWSGPVPTSDEDIAFLPAHRLSALIKAKKVTPSRLTDIYLARLEKLNPTLLCAVTILADQARAEAKQADAEIAAGKYRGPLHGIPYGIKDLFATKGVPTTWGSQDFESRVFDYDSEIVVRLREAGAILIAKLATGLYAQNDQWFRGRTNNPWNLSQGSSGSSAGPASATAAACVAFGIGTETQGSIVSPSVQCGVSALRPTFGRVSRHGGMVLAWSQDRAGPICRSAEDCAMVFNAIHGVDEKDPSTVMMPFHFDSSIKLASLRIGIDPGTPAGADGRGARGGAPDDLVAKLRALGMAPKTIGARPNQGLTMGNAGGLNAEYASAFDDLVTRKAKELGLDINAVADSVAASGRGGGGGGGGGRGGAADNAPIPGSSTPKNPAARGADWNPRFVVGRSIRAYEFLQVQRRRYIYTRQWADFMKELDLFIGANADVAANAQTGHPCAVLPYKFDVPPSFGGGRGGRGGAPDAPPPPPLNPQPICGVIVGNLYNDDLILSVAHQFQAQTDFHLRKPKLG